MATSEISATPACLKIIHVSEAQVSGAALEPTEKIFKVALRQQSFRSVEDKIQCRLIFKNSHIAVEKSDPGPHAGVVLRQHKSFDIARLETAKFRIHDLTHTEVMQRGGQGDTKQPQQAEPDQKIFPTAHQ